MFGYLVANTELLDEEQQLRYKACYCGLCRSLKERHGQLSRMTLNFDMTFLVLLLGSLYEPSEQREREKCIAHPAEPRPWWRTEFTDYAADMNVALAYLKCMDDWADDSNPIALAEAGMLKRAYKTISAQYPRQCEAMDLSLRELHRLEQAGEESPDRAADCFAMLMGEIFAPREDYWSTALRSTGQALGRFIYVMDACMDLESDTLFNRYNPFRRYYGLDNEQRFRDILKMLLGDCVREFDRLPLVQDADILKNILCVGLWTEFDKKYSLKKKKGPSDGTGSV